MQKIDKVSQISWSDVADYLRLYTEPGDTGEINTLDTLINISKSFICGYTGKTLEELDNYPAFVIVVLILCQDMWDNRSMYIDKTNMNKVIESILSLYRTNYL